MRFVMLREKFHNDRVHPLRAFFVGVVPAIIAVGIAVGVGPSQAAVINRKSSQAAAFLGLKSLFLIPKATL
jgi:hypothetical protein